jgi:hypothetical protein
MTLRIDGPDALDRLARDGAGMKHQLGHPMLDQVADLVLRLHQSSARAAGAILPVRLQRSYAQYTETERLGMRCAVEHVLTALVLLDIIDQPGT